MSHKTISFIKSFVRIVGYCLLPISVLVVPAEEGMKLFWVASGVLVASEVIGVIEEIGE